MATTKRGDISTVQGEEYFMVELYVPPNEKYPNYGDYTELHGPYKTLPIARARKTSLTDRGRYWNNGETAKIYKSKTTWEEVE